MSGFSDTIVYVDESGDHSLESIDPQFPVFTLAFCIFDKKTYSTEVVRALQQFKFAHFGHDAVILHERDIRKQTGQFGILVDKNRREQFLDELTDIIKNAPFTLVAVAIEKRRLTARYKEPSNPYALALRFGLERIHTYLQRDGEQGKTTHVIVESRGKKEDDQLQLEFLKVCGGNNYKNTALPFSLVFASKLANSSGLQLADLIARPVSRHVLAPDQQNRAFVAFQDKFFRSDKGVIGGFGLKVFP